MKVKLIICFESSFLQNVIDAMRSVNINVDLGSYGMLSLACQSADDAKQFFDELAEYNIR